MNIQTKASFKKELLAYVRTFKLLTVSLVVFGLAVLSPLMIAGMGSLMDSMSDFYEELGTDVSGMTEALSETTSIGVVSAIESITGAALIVMIILINRAAGGEQKRRAVIIPKSSGLRSFSYIFPKYIIYPVSAFLVAVVSVLAAWAVSIPLFEINDVAFGSALLAGAIAGVHLMLYICFHLTLGTASGRAGMSAAVCIAVSILLPTVLAFAGTDYMYNPFTLNIMASFALQTSTLSGAELLDIIATVAFALGIMVLTCFIAIFAQNAKKIDNSGNEIDL